MIELIIATKFEKIRKQTLNHGTYTIGNQDSCAIPLLFPTVSKQHGTLRIFADQVLYKDEESKNGSYLNEQKISPKQFIQWSLNHVLKIGPFYLTWHSLVEQTQEQTNSLLKYCETYSRLLGSNPIHAQTLFQEELSRLEGKQADLIFEKIFHEFHDHGPLREIIDNNRCREVLINNSSTVYVDFGEGLVEHHQKFICRQTYESWVQRLVHQANRRLDFQNPICEATLPNGARLHAVMPPIATHGVSISIRRFGAAPVTEEQALESGWVDQQVLCILKDALTKKKNTVISGGTSSGKTSLLNFLCQFFRKDERIITIEDTVELNPPVQNKVQLQARKPNADGVGTISLRELVQCALRMRPDRIIVGECRGPEVLDMLQVMNTGHPGSLTTIHANSCEDAIHRLELLALLGATNLAFSAIQTWICSTIDLIIQLERDTFGHRHISEIFMKDKGMIYRRH